MAINEACQVWIEQRIQEELETGDGKTKSMVARAISEEIERIFETKVNEETIRSKVRRMSRSNDRIDENQGAPTVKAGDSGDIVREVERKVRAGKSIREAAAEVAETHGKNTETVRKAYNRETERVGDPARASQAMHIVGYAIVQLERLTKSDPRWEEAITKLESWIARFKEQGE